MPFVPPAGQQSDKQLNDAQFSFKGSWQPDFDPAKIGPDNYRTLQNLRYIDGGLEGTLGYTQVNTTALTTYTKVWNGFHFRTDYTQTTYVLVHAVDPNTGQGRVYENRTAIGSQGDFGATQLHADSSVNLIGRFSNAPGGGVAYCNKNGDESRVSGFFRCTDATFANPEDYTEEVNNTLSTADERVALEVGTKPFWIIFSTRPLIEVKYDLQAANVGASTMTGFYFNGSTFAALSNLVDGTASGGTSMAVDGTVTFDAQTDAAPYHFQGLYLYAYYFTIDAGTGCNVTQVTIKAAWQAMVDVWDGVYRQPIQCQFDNNSTGGLEDYTLQVNESSSIDLPIGCELAGMTTSDKLYIMLEERTSALKLVMLADLLNTTTLTMVVKYFNGTSYTAVANLTDGTAKGGKPLAQSGLVSWAPPASTSEKKQTAYGTTGYMYEITFTGGSISGTEGDQTVIIDLITAVPAQKKVRPFTFSGLYKNRLMRGDYSPGKEGNRMDFTSKDAAEVWNGFDSSMNGIQSLYFGGMDALTGAVQLYNRFGSRVYAVFLVVKNNETYILDGESPSDYKIYPVSKKVGCPAPLTIDTAEIGFNLSEDIQRNVAIWLSYNGPVMFDGAVLKPIDGIDIYFDPNSDNPINTDAITECRGWVDQTNSEYNLLLPVGSGQTTCNKWFIYDLKRKKWYEKEVSTSNPLQCGVPVNTSTGVQYVYGGTLTGRLMFLENGTDWDGVDIRSVVTTGDFWPSENIWHQTRIRFLMIVTERIDEDVSLDLFHLSDTDVSGTDQISFTDTDDVEFTDTTDVEWANTSSVGIELDLSGETERLIRNAGAVDLLAWTHGFSFELATNSTSRAFKPVAWGIRWEYERHEKTR
jgi:hypothetical protein